MTANDLIKLLQANPNAEIYHHDCEWGISVAMLEPVKCIFDNYVDLPTGEIKHSTNKISLSQSQIDQCVNRIDQFKLQDLEANFNNIVKINAEVPQKYFCFARGKIMTLEMFKSDHDLYVKKEEQQLNELNAAPWSFIINGV